MTDITKNSNANIKIKKKISLWKDCKYAPAKPYAKHCKKFNEGRITLKKMKDGKKVTGKGYYGCNGKCRFFEAA